MLIPRLPAGLYGRLTAPGEGDALRPGLVSVAGWAARDGGRLAELRIRAQGVEIGRTADASPRRWRSGRAPVPARLRSRVVAWACQAELTGLAPGPTRLDAEIRLDGDDWTVLDSVCILLASETHCSRVTGRITAPAADTQLTDSTVTVSGYAVHPEGPVGAVVVCLNGEPVARVRPGLSSPAAQELWPALPWSGDAGWEAAVGLATTPGDEVELVAEALGPDDVWLPFDRVGLRLAGRGPKGIARLTRALRSLRRVHAPV